LKPKDSGNWFNLKYLETEEIENNKHFENQTFDGEKEFEGLTVLQHRILIEEFYHFEKIKNDFIIYLTKFFDNTKTNIYNKILEGYKSETNKSLFDFFFRVLNRYSYLLDLSKTKKNLLGFIKVILETTNEETIKQFIDYFKDNIYQMTQEAENVQSKLTKKGRSNQITKYFSSIPITHCFNQPPKNS
jgi:hypothetical protein